MIKIGKKTFVNIENGILNIPFNLIDNQELKKHTDFMILEEGGSIKIIPSIHSLSTIYIEPTSYCNLNCTTCIRKTWQEKSGFINIEVFNKLLNEMSGIKTINSVMFGGFGEPTSHPDILYMIKSLHKLGLITKITTNGTLTDNKMISGLIEAGLDELWISIDGTNADKFDEIRQGADFNKVYANLKTFKALNKNSNKKIKLGIAFVATKDNVNELSQLRRFASKFGAEMISVSNVIPYEKDMEDKMLCKKTLFNLLPYRREKISGDGFNEIIIPEISLPRIDYNDDTKEGMHDINSSIMKVKILDEHYNDHINSCRFIKKGITFIRWDGNISPCMGLLHTYKTFLNGNERTINEYVLGNILEDRLEDIWTSEKYVRFREKVYDFDFSPCTTCGGCEDNDTNENDCMKNESPVCGGCLWAQGVIQCP